jgi:hypothetical protein
MGSDNLAYSGRHLHCISFAIFGIIEIGGVLVTGLTTRIVLWLSALLISWIVRGGRIAVDGDQKRPSSGLATVRTEVWQPISMEVITSPLSFMVEKTIDTLCFPAETC